MFDNRMIGAVAIASAVAFGVVTQASASPILGIELMESGYATYSTGPVSGTSLLVAQSFGTFSTNFEISHIVTNPLSLDLTSLNDSTSTAGTLTIIASAADLTTPAYPGFFTQFSGSLPDAVTSATFKTYLSSTNTLFGTDILLSSLSGAGTFGTSSLNPTAATGLFAITEIMTITTSGSADNISLDGRIASAPEIDAASGGAAIALLLGVLGLVGERRRQPTATA
jgi:hypothetical protein